MLMGDPARALSESRRVLRPDGRLILAVWGSAERNPWLSVILNAEAAIAEAQDYLAEGGGVVFPAMIVGAKARRAPA